MRTRSPHLDPERREEIAATPDDRILATMTRRIFQAGFAWKVIDAKWDGFEAAFDYFDLGRCASMSEERFDALLKDSSIVRNAAKIRSVTLNGQFLARSGDGHGSAARFFADWPDANYVGLLDLLKRRANRLGGEPAMRFLRSIGKPAFMRSPYLGPAADRRSRDAGSSHPGCNDPEIFQAGSRGWWWTPSGKPSR